MKTITYKGPFPNLVTEWNGKRYRTDRGIPTDIPDDLAEYLKDAAPASWTTAAPRSTTTTSAKD